MAADHHAPITLIGGGLAGALLAAFLGKAGRPVTLYERRADPAAGNFVGGRSINLAISTRGIAALDRVGLADEILRQAIPMRGRLIHGRRGDLHFQPYDKDPSRCINSIGRAALNSLTLAAAQRYSNVRVLFNHHCTDVDLDRPAAVLQNTETGETTTAEAGVLIGVDGAFSAVRRAMQRTDRFDYSQSYLRHGYKELSIPPAQGGGFQMEKNALHIWPRKRFMMIALPNPDGSFTCTLFYPHHGPESFDRLQTDAQIRGFFHREFPDAVARMTFLLDDYHAHPVGSMVTIRCAPWRLGAKVALLGDAAHAVVPFYGQGANAAFEDCIVLDDCLREHRHDFASAFAEYQRRRKPDCDALADLAVQNFYEMRDKTASRAFRADKTLQRVLHRALPGLYTPLYTLVSFTRTPYAQAVRRARIQDRIVRAALIFILIAVLSGVIRLASDERWLACIAAAAVPVLIVVCGLAARRKISDDG